MGEGKRRNVDSLRGSGCGRELVCLFLHELRACELDCII